MGGRGWIRRAKARCPDWSQSEHPKHIAQCHPPMCAHCFTIQRKCFVPCFLKVLLFILHIIDTLRDHSFPITLL